MTDLLGENTEESLMYTLSMVLNGPSSKNWAFHSVSGFLIW